MCLPGHGHRVLHYSYVGIRRLCPHRKTIKMTYDPQKHHRKSIRLKEYDYSKPNAYFITICTYNKECIFGAIINGEMQLNEYGKIVANEWLKTPTIRQYVLLDKYIIMPNHFHGIIIITDNRRGTAPMSSRATVEVAESRVSRDPRLNNLEGQHHILSRQLFVHSRQQQQNKYMKSKKTTARAVWQPRFYEHIIRNPHELDQTREYIIYNPLKWALDSENPDNKT